MFKINKDVITAISCFAFIFCLVIASECLFVSLFSGYTIFILYTMILCVILNLFLKIVPDIKKEIIELIHI